MSETCNSDNDCDGAEDERDTCFLTSLAVYNGLGGWSSLNKFFVAHRAWATQRSEFVGSTDNEVCIIMSQVLGESDE